jgi:hypothetical protein
VARPACSALRALALGRAGSTHVQGRQGGTHVHVLGAHVRRHQLSPRMLQDVVEVHGVGLGAAALAVPATLATDTESHKTSRWVLHVRNNNVCVSTYIARHAPCVSGDRLTDFNMRGTGNSHNACGSWPAALRRARPYPATAFSTHVGRATRRKQGAVAVHSKLVQGHAVRTEATTLSRAHAQESRPATEVERTSSRVFQDVDGTCSRPTRSADASAHHTAASTPQARAHAPP